MDNIIDSGTVNVNNTKTLYQNFDEIMQKENNEQINSKNIPTESLKESTNIHLTSNTYTYNDQNTSNYNTGYKTYEPNYTDKNRSKSANNRQTVYEKYELINMEDPSIRNRNFDPTAEIIIHHLERKIDVLGYENYLLSNQVKGLFNDNKELQNNLSQKISLLNEQEKKIDNIRINKMNNNGEIEQSFGKNNNNLYNEIKKLKEQNMKLIKINENLTEDNNGLNKIIEELKNNKKLIQIKYNEEIQKYKNLLNKQNNKINDCNANNDYKNIDLNYKNYIYDNNLNKSYNYKLNINESNNIEKNNIYINYDQNKYLINQEKFKKLLDDNERLHKRIFNLLSINDDDFNRISYGEGNLENTNFHSKENSQTFYSDINNSNLEDLIKENLKLKQIIKQLNDEINSINTQQSKKLSKIQEKIDGYELRKYNTKKKSNLNIINENYNINKNEELDKLLNDEILMNNNLKNEETKKIFSSFENINDIPINTIGQSLLIKIKSLLEENNLLKNKLSKMKNEGKIVSHIKTTKQYIFENNKDGTYDDLLNLLKEKDEIIQKYKDKEEELKIKNKELNLQNQENNNNTLKTEDNMSNM